MSLKSKVHTFLQSSAEQLFDRDYVLNHNFKPILDVLPYETNPQGLSVRQVAQFGGEGEGEVYWVVVEFTSDVDDGNTVLVRLNGSYSSYNGSEYSCYEFVKPTLVERVEYIAV